MLFYSTTLSNHIFSWVPAFQQSFQRQKVAGQQQEIGGRGRGRRWWTVAATDWRSMRRHAEPVSTQRGCRREEDQGRVEVGCRPSTGPIWAAGPWPWSGPATNVSCSTRAGNEARQAQQTLRQQLWQCARVGNEARQAAVSATVAAICYVMLCCVSSHPSRG